MSRNLSPALVTEYKIKLIDKRILEEKLDELFELSVNSLSAMEHRENIKNGCQ
ncbi:MAG: hypothetical protein ABRQ39_18845 [Candidatus Eremiobacterota bacterium]